MSMLEFSKNIADQEAPPQLPASEYPCQCVGAVVGETKEKKEPKIELTMQINRQDFPADFDPGDGVDDIKFTQHIRVLDIPSDRFRLRKLCEAFGIPMSNNIDVNEFVGKHARLKTKMGKDLEGNPRAEIDRILKP